jgi:hypothetical protein
MAQYESTELTPARPFSVIACLKEGYGPDGKMHTQEEAEEAIEDWNASQARAGKDYLPGTVHPLKYVLGHGKGATGGASREPGIEFRCNASAYLNDKPDTYIRQLLDELAAVLAKALGQQRIELSFNGKQWAYQVKK